MTIKNPIKLNVKRTKRSAGRLLVIDADIIAYQAVTLCVREQRQDGKYGEEYSYSICERDFKSEVTSRLDALLSLLESQELILCFGSKSNWRKQILKTYKANRSDRKPLGYSQCVDWMMKSWPSLTVPALEADDLVGLIHTGSAPHISRGRKTVAVSEDKDFFSIPGLLHNPRRINRVLYDVPLEVACYMHMKQTLMGDTADNYRGCPGVGTKKAEKILTELKGGSIWQSVLQAFEKAGLSEEDAYIQARVARILQGDEYDFDSGKLTLWEPSKIEACTWVGTNHKPWEVKP